MAFTCCWTLSWLLKWLQSEVVDPHSIHCHISMQKLICCVKAVANKSSTSCFWSTVSKCNTHFEHKLSHWQMFMQNGEYTAFCNLQLLSHATSIMIFFFGVFRDNYRIWATRASSIVCVFYTTAFNCCFWRSRVRITYQTIALLEQYFPPPPSESNPLWTHQIQIFFHCFENLQP